MWRRRWIGKMTAGGSIDQKLETFLREVEAADDEMEALCDELSCLLVSAYRLRVWLAPMDRHAPALVSAATTAGMRSRLLGSARCLRARLAPMDRCAPAPASAATTAGLRGRLQDLTAGVLVLRRQISAERRGDAARYYLAVVGEATTEEQLDRLVAAGHDVPD